MDRHELLFNRKIQHELTGQEESSVVERLVLAFKSMPQFKNQDGSYKKNLLKEPKEKKQFCNRIRRTLGDEVAELQNGIKFAVLSSKFFVEDGEALRDEDILLARQLFSGEHPFSIKVESLKKKYGSMSCLEVLGEVEFSLFLGQINFPFSSISNLVGVFGGVLTENCRPRECGIEAKFLENAVVGSFVRTDKEMGEPNWVTVWYDEKVSDKFVMMPYSEYCEKVSTSKRGD